MQCNLIFIGWRISNKINEKKTLIFIEQRDSTNSDIKRTFKQRFEADVRRVNTLVRPNGKKKTIVTLKGSQAAVEL